MDLKNLPSRYSKVSDEMAGSKQARDILNTQPKSLLTDNKPNAVEDIKTMADRPGFLTWKQNDEPWFNLKGSAKISGKSFDLDSALQQKLDAGIQKQGKPMQEFPNVKPLVVEKDGDDNDNKTGKTELGQVDTGGRKWLYATGEWLYAAGIFGLGLAAGWWLAKRA